MTEAFATCQCGQRLELWARKESEPFFWSRPSADYSGAWLAEHDLPGAAVFAATDLDAEIALFGEPGERSGHDVYSAERVTYKVLLARGRCRAGRKTKPAAEKREQRMTFLATEAEEAAILTRVPPGRDFSDWARERLLSE